jgi:hypothetical protein
MTSIGVTTVNRLQVLRDRLGVAAYLASGDLTEDVAALLRRWAGPRHPAVLVALDWEIPFADVYAEDELLDAFPDTPLIPAEPIDEMAQRRLLIFVIDEEGDTAYAIADPRASH